jgi:SAM-dependent methyltransferase
VLDFASGSGLVAIAAAKAGAGEVSACDIDAFALAAIGLNAEANGVAIGALQADLVGQDHGWDTVLAGDICYERDTAERVVAWLQTLGRRGATVLIGDPGRSYLPKMRLEALATYEVPVTRSLEDAEIKRSSVWRFKALAAASMIRRSAAKPSVRAAGPGWRMIGLLISWSAPACTAGRASKPGRAATWAGTKRLPHQEPTITSGAAAITSSGVTKRPRASGARERSANTSTPPAISTSSETQRMPQIMGSFHSSK